jgi:hypothetical protein
METQGTTTTPEMTPEQIEHTKAGFNSVQSREIAFESVALVPEHPMRIEFKGRSLLAPYLYNNIGVQLESFDDGELRNAGKDAATFLGEWALAAHERYAQSTKEDD